MAGVCQSHRDYRGKYGGGVDGRFPQKTVGVTYSAIYYHRIQYRFHFQITTIANLIDKKVGMVRTPFFQPIECKCLIQIALLMLCC